MGLEHGSGNDDHSKSNPVVSEGSGGSIGHQDAYPRLRVRVESSDSFEMNPEATMEGSGSSSKSSGVSDPEVIDGNDEKGSSRNQYSYESNTNTEVIVEDDNESSNHSESGSAPRKVMDGGGGVGVNDGNPFQPALKVRSPSSSSSSHSSLDDLFPVADTELGSFNPRKFSTHTPPPHDEGAHQTTAAAAPQEHQFAAPSSNSSSKSDQEDGNSSTGQSLTFPVADATAHESLRRSESSPTMSPPVQVMDRSSSGYDPLRIPLSVFEPSSTTLDWSCASNDSLFSIHVGNNSFSRDQQNLFNDLKAEELDKLEESHILSPTEPFPEVDREEELKVPVAETANQSIETQNYQGAAAPGVGAVDNKTNENATQMAVQDHTHQKRESPHPSLSSKSSSRSNKSGSGDSDKSFAFPIKRRKKCSWTSCYFSNCSWAFCYCWNCSRKVWWCCLSPAILSGGLKNGSDKVDIEEQHLQAPSSAGTSKSDFRHWFRCFSCPSWSCPSCRCRFRRRCRCCCSFSCHSCYSCCC